MGSHNTSPGSLDDQPKGRRNAAPVVEVPCERSLSSVVLLSSSWAEPRLCPLARTPARHIRRRAGVARSHHRECKKESVRWRRMRRGALSHTRGSDSDSDSDAPSMLLPMEPVGDVARDDGEAPRPELVRPLPLGRAAAAAGCSLASLASARLELAMALSVLALAVAPGDSTTEKNQRQYMTVLVKHVSKKGSGELLESQLFHRRGGGGAHRASLPSPPTASHVPCSQPCDRGSPRPGCVLSPCADARTTGVRVRAAGRLGFCTSAGVPAPRWGGGSDRKTDG